MSERVVWVIENREIGETVWTPTLSCLTDKESADRIANLCELPNTEWRAWPYAAKESAQ